MNEQIRPPTPRRHSLTRSPWPFRAAASALVAVLCQLATPPTAAAQIAPVAERSPAHADALARVQLRGYAMAQAGGAEIEYGLYIPTSYDEAAPTPLVVALHGLGSGPMYMMEYSNLVELAETYGFIVATPMGFNPRGWYGSRGAGNDFNANRDDPGPPNLGELSELDVLNVLEIVRRDLNVDDRRIYLIGQSMGGGGTLHLAMKYPHHWTAIAAMAPAVYSDPERIAAARAIPAIVVMGDTDELVDVEVTRSWVAQMQAAGMNYEYIEVPGGSHSSAGRDNIDKVFEFLARHRN